MKIENRRHASIGRTAISVWFRIRNMNENSNMKRCIKQWQKIMSRTFKALCSDSCFSSCFALMDCKYSRTSGWNTELCTDSKCELQLLVLIPFNTLWHFKQQTFSAVSETQKNWKTLDERDEPGEEKVMPCTTSEFDICVSDAELVSAAFSSTSIWIDARHQFSRNDSQ